MKLTKIKTGESMNVEVSGGVAKSVAPEDGILIHLFDDKESGGRARVPVFVSIREFLEVIDE